MPVLALVPVGSEPRSSSPPGHHLSPFNATQELFTNILMRKPTNPYLSCSARARSQIWHSNNHQLTDGLFNTNQEHPKTLLDTNFLIFDAATQSQGTVIKRGFARCWKRKAVLPASGSAPPCRTEQRTTSVDLANHQSSRRSPATASPFKAHPLKPSRTNACFCLFRRSTGANPLGAKRVYLCL